MKKLIVSIFALAAVVYSAYAANTVNGTGSADIVTSIAIAPGAGGSTLEFGRIALGTTASTVTVAAAAVANRTKASGDVTLLASGATPKAAQFTVTGSGTHTFALTMAQTTTLANGISISNINPSALTGSAGSYIGTLTAGTISFYVGGTLNIAANATEGAYSQTFPLTVAYN